MGQEGWCPLGSGTLGSRNTSSANGKPILHGCWRASLGPQTLMASTPHTGRQLVPWRGSHEGVTSWREWPAILTCYYDPRTEWDPLCLVSWVNK